jgi:hypothetical protein
MLRRLRAAAEKGGAAGVWLGEPGEGRVPAALRFEVEPSPLRAGAVTDADGDAPIVRRARDGGAAAPCAAGGGRRVHGDAEAPPRGEERRRAPSRWPVERGHAA